MKKTTPALLLSSLIVALSPFVASAYSATNIKDLLQGTVDNILKPVVVILIGLAVLATLWNGFKIVKESGGKDIAKYRTALIMSIIALAVMVSFWGIIGIMRDTFGLTRSDSVLNRLGSGSTNINGQIVSGSNAQFTAGSAESIFLNNSSQNTTIKNSYSSGAGTIDGAGFDTKSIDGVGVVQTAGASSGSFQSIDANGNMISPQNDAIKTVGGSGNANSNNDSVVSDMYGNQGAGWQGTKQVDTFNNTVAKPTNGFINWIFK
ncbi:MAG: pilin [bacterium]